MARHGASHLAEAITARRTCTLPRQRELLEGIDADVPVHRTFDTTVSCSSSRSVLNPCKANS
jgi:hypothetical protein